MPATYEPIATTTLGSAASSITFSSIPGTYTDLRLVLAGTGAANVLGMQFNNDTGSNYSATSLAGNGTAAASFRETSATRMEMDPYGLNATTIQFWFVDIFSYAGSTNKTALIGKSGDRNGAGNVTRSVGLWRSTSAITSVKFLIDGGGNFDSGFSATLYGILKA